jgi:predicted dehydrogenase
VPRTDLWATEVEDYYSFRLIMPSGVHVTVEASNNARLAPPRWFVVGSEATLIADGTWGKWTSMRIRRTVSGVDMDMRPQGEADASSGRSMAVDDQLSRRFYQNLACVLTMGGQPEVPIERARDVIALIDAGRQSIAQGRTIAPAEARGTYGHRRQPAPIGENSGR